MLNVLFPAWLLPFILQNIAVVLHDYHDTRD